MNNKELTELKKFIDGRIEFLFDHWVEHDKPPYTFGGWREEVVNDIANKLTSLNDEIKREAYILGYKAGWGDDAVYKTNGELEKEAKESFDGNKSLLGLTQKENNE